MSTVLRRHAGLSRRGLLFLTFALLALIVAGYAFSGVALAGSFAGVDERTTQHWRSVALAYEVLLVVALASFLGAAVAFRRAWQRR